VLSFNQKELLVLLLVTLTSYGQRAILISYDFVVDVMKYIRVERFNLADTIQCGQTFTWVREGQGYVNSDLGQVVYIEQEGDRLFYEASSAKAVPLRKLFRLDDPLDDIQGEVIREGVMRKSIEFAPDMRIINDPFFPCLVSFICSTYKNIPAIHKMMDNIRRMWGPAYKLRGKTYYGIPTPEQLVTASVKELESAGLGYRAKFIKRTSEMIVDDLVSERDLRRMTYSEARAALKSLHGVGDKVADCVSLFSLGFLEAFPIDVWIERVIQEHYDMFMKTGRSYAKKSKAAREYFGRYSGYAQQYLYHFSRSLRRV
jgi:N-glycosylase/DNA lyase